MQVVAKQGEGKFILAARNIAVGELVHVSHSLVCLPNIGKIVAGSWCVGCVRKMKKPKQQLQPSRRPNTVKESFPQLIQQPSHCPHCNSCFCSSACLAQEIESHMRTGECAVIGAMNNGGKAKTTHADDSDLHIVACLIARAMAAGYRIPVGVSKPVAVSSSSSSSPSASRVMMTTTPATAAPTTSGKSKNSSKGGGDAIIVMTVEQFRTLQREDAAFVMSQPRDCIEKVFPEMIASFENEVKKAAKKSNSNLEQQDTDLTHTTAVPSSSLHFDVAERVAAFSQTPQPDVAEFFRNVSNARLVTPKQPQGMLDRLQKMHMRYRSIASRVLQKQQQRQQEAESKANDKGEDDDEPSIPAPAAAAASSPSVCFFAPQVSWDFFSHVSSTYSSNCFGVYDHEKSECAGSGVFPTSSYFNHSCSPTLVRRQCGKSLAFYATRDISAGTPLTIDYGSLHEKWPDDLDARREHLLTGYRFWCGCELCVAQEAHAKGKKKIESQPNDNATVDEEDDNKIKCQQKEENPESKRCSNCSFNSIMRCICRPAGEDKRTLVGRECRYCYFFEQV